MLMGERMAKLVNLLENAGLSGLALNPGPSLAYFTGLDFHLMERPTVLLVTMDGKSAFVLPHLEQGKLQPESAHFKIFAYGDNPAAWPASFVQAADWLGLAPGKIGVEPTRMRFLELGYLKQAFPKFEFVDGQQSIAALRMIKEETEIKKMKQAARIAQEALLVTLKTLQEGMTEKAIANKLVIQLLRAGSDPHLPFPPIVAIGENSANPHAVPTDRPLQRGDLLLVDWGAGFDGYFSDITRTFTYGEPDSELLEIGEIVMAANLAGRRAGRPGVEAGAVDRAARAVITDASYGDAFTHRTGHGLGMEAHEPPYIFAENDLVLVPGMTFTVEPGIYLPGKGGVRIEDDVVVTDTGLMSLTDLPREVTPLEDMIN
jgi:Xaa-Pro dipeptidase